MGCLYDRDDPRNMCLCQAITAFILLQISFLVSVVALMVPQWAYTEKQTSNNSTDTVGLWATCNKNNGCMWSGTPVRTDWFRACQVLMCISVISLFIAFWIGWTKLCTEKYRRSYAANAYIITFIVISSIFALTIVILFGLEARKNIPVMSGQTSIGWTYFLNFIFIGSGLLSCIFYAVEGFALKRSMRGYYEITESGGFI